MREFGLNLKRARLARQCTLKELSAHSGVSQSMLSEIERGLKMPTIEVACKIADALAVNILALLEKERKDKVIVIRRNERPALVSQDSTKRYLLSPSLPFSRIEFEYCVMPFGKTTGPIRRHHPPIKEHLVVMQGKIALSIQQQEEYVLEEGDSIFYEIALEHEVVNIGEGDAHFFYIAEGKNKERFLLGGGNHGQY